MDLGRVRELLRPSTPRSRAVCASPSGTAMSTPTPVRSSRAARSSTVVLHDVAAHQDPE